MTAQMNMKDSNSDHHIAVNDVAEKWRSIDDTSQAECKCGKKASHLQSSSHPTRSSARSQSPPASPQFLANDTRGHQLRGPQDAYPRIDPPPTRIIVTSPDRCITILLMIISAIIASLITILASPALSRLICGR